MNKHLKLKNLDFSNFFSKYISKGKPQLLKERREKNCPVYPHDTFLTFTSHRSLYSGTLQASLLLWLSRVQGVTGNSDDEAIPKQASLDVRSPEWRSDEKRRQGPCPSPQYPRTKETGKRATEGTPSWEQDTTVWNEPVYNDFEHAHHPRKIGMKLKGNIGRRAALMFNSTILNLIAKWNPRRPFFVQCNTAILTLG